VCDGGEACVHRSGDPGDAGGGRDDLTVRCDPDVADRKLCGLEVVQRGVEGKRLSRRRIEGDGEVQRADGRVRARNRQHDARRAIRGRDLAGDVDQGRAALRVEEHVALQQQRGGGEAHVLQPDRARIIKFDAGRNLAFAAEKGPVFGGEERREITGECDVHTLRAGVRVPGAAQGAGDPVDIIGGKAEGDLDILERALTHHRQPQTRRAGKAQQLRREPALGLLKQQVDPKDARRIVEACVEREAASGPVEAFEPQIGTARPPGKLRRTADRQGGGDAHDGFAKRDLGNRDLPDVDADGQIGQGEGRGLGRGKVGTLRRKGRAEENEAVCGQCLDIQFTGQDTGAPPVQPRALKDQPFAIGVRNAQPVKRGFRGQRAAKAVDAHLSVVAVRKLRFEKLDEATAVIVLRMDGKRQGRAARRRKDQGAHQNACPMPI
jgi:hypothetical protein